MFADLWTGYVFDTIISAGAGVVVVQTVVLSDHVYKVNWNFSIHDRKSCHYCCSLCNHDASHYFCRSD